MAQKETYPINRFDGGVNTDTNARDIQEGQYKIGHNVDTVVVGRIKCPGDWATFYDLETVGDDIWKDDVDTIAGYGIFPFNVDKDITIGVHNSVEGHYIAIYKPADATIAMYVDPVTSSYVVSSGTANGNTDDKLIDPTATFIADGVKVGDLAFNTASNDTAAVTNLDGETTLSLGDDIFPDGNETYSVKSGSHCVGPVFSISSASVDSNVSGIDQLGDTNYNANTKVAYLYVDGSLIVYDVGTSTTNWAKPVKWYFWDSGITYFYNTNSTTGSGSTPRPAIILPLKPTPTVFNVSCI